MGAAEVGLLLVGLLLGGPDVVGLAVVGLAVVGLAVVGLAEVGLLLVGLGVGESVGHTTCDRRYNMLLATGGAMAQQSAAMVKHRPWLSKNDKHSCGPAASHAWRQPSTVVTPACSMDSAVQNESLTKT